MLEMCFSTRFYDAGMNARKGFRSVTGTSGEAGQPPRGVRQIGEAEVRRMSGRLMMEIGVHLSVKATPE